MREINKMIQDWAKKFSCSITNQLLRYATQLKLHLRCKSWSHKKHFKHLQYAVFVITGLFMLNAAIAQTTITGTIKDKKKAPLENAGIKVQNTNDAAISDSAGNFSFLTMAKGDQTIAISSLGFQTLEKNISINDSVLVLNIALQVAEKTLEPIEPYWGKKEVDDLLRQLK